MRREILKLGAGWVLCAAWAACGADNTFTDKQHGFQITFPERWGATGGGSGGWYAWASDVEFGLVSVRVTDLKEGEGLRSFFTDPANRRWLTGWTVADIRMEKLSGINAFKLTVVKDGQQWVIHYVVAGGHGYAIWCSALLQSDFDKCAKDFDAIVASFKIIEAK